MDLAFARVTSTWHPVTVIVFVNIDEDGRSFLPKAAREALGIEGRTLLRLEVVGGVAHLSRAATGAGPARREGGRLVFAGSLPENWDCVAAVAASRRLIAICD